LCFPSNPHHTPQVLRTSLQNKSDSYITSSSPRISGIGGYI